MSGLVDKIQWHPGFYGAAELELRKNKKDLEFEREYNLSKEPLRVDLLIVKKRGDAVVENEIGHIFRRFNVLEYKSPDDGMTIDDYFKAIGYACIYKGLGTTVDKVPAEELTVSLFRESYPREMMKALKKLGATIEEKYPGIYYVSGIILFNTQIVVTSQLREEIHSSLRILSAKVKEEDIHRFLMEVERFETPGDRNNADAILQVSISANQKIYEKVRGNSEMCEALEELMKDVIDKKVEESNKAGIAEGMAKGRAEGIAKGRTEGIAKGRAEGIVEGIAESIISVLSGLSEVPENLKNAIINVKDVETLKVYLQQAVKAKSIEDFEDFLRQQ